MVTRKKPTDNDQHNPKYLESEASKLKTESVDRNELDSAVHAKEVEVERGLVINPKHADVEHVVIPEEKKKGCACCVLQ